MICFAACATFFSHYMQYIAISQTPDGEILVLDAFLAVNAVQLLFNITSIVEILGIFILKHRE